DEIRDLFPALVLMEQCAPIPKATGGALPRLLGDYRLLREIGRGGMGVVYEAEHLALGRRVALKILDTEAVRNPTHLQRFQREAAAAARLHHTNIVPVYGSGECDGVH